MKVSKTQASGNRNAILHAAAAQLRAQGFGQMSVAEVAKSAGLTHGALYSHFTSKDALQAEATQRAFADSAAAFTGLMPDEFITRYLSPNHRDTAADGCPTAALVCETPRQSPAAKAAFREGLAHFAALTADTLHVSKDRATFALAAMVGALTISRAIRDVDEPASNDILRAVAGELRQVLAAK